MSPSCQSRAQAEVELNLWSPQSPELHTNSLAQAEPRLSKSSRGMSPNLDFQTWLLVISNLRFILLALFVNETKAIHSLHRQSESHLVINDVLSLEYNSTASLFSIF